MIFNDFGQSSDTILTNQLVILSRNCSLIGGNDTIEIFYKQFTSLLHWIESITIDYHLYLSQTFGIIALKLSDPQRSQYITTIWRILQHKIHSNTTHVKIGGLICSTTLLIGLLSSTSILSSSSSSSSSSTSYLQSSELLHMIHTHLDTLKTIAFNSTINESNEFLLKSAVIENLGLLLSCKLYNTPFSIEQKQSTELFKSIPELISKVNHSFHDILQELYNIIKQPKITIASNTSYLLDPNYILLICNTLQSLSYICSNEDIIKAGLFLFFNFFVYYYY